MQHPPPDPTDLHTVLWLVGHRRPGVDAKGNALALVLVEARIFEGALALLAVEGEEKGKVDRGKISGEKKVYRKGGAAVARKGAKQGQRHT